MANGVIHPALSGAAMQFLAKEFGGLVAARDSDIGIGTSPVVFAGSDPERVGLAMFNLGATTLFVSPSGIVSATHGIRLGPNGGGLSLKLGDDMILVSYPWRAVSDAAGGRIFWVEIVRESVRISGA